nr:A24 family peptidase [Mammaliicoccus sp. Marseille-Q6498]
MILTFLFGTIMASYIYQLAGSNDINYKTLTQRSSCSHCNNQLKLWDLVPIFSYLYLRGKCHYCNSKIPIDLLIVELLLGILFILPFFSLTMDNLLLYYYVIIFLIPLSIYDVIHFVIPNHILFIMFIVSIFIFDIFNTTFYISLAIILLLHFLYFISREGIGYGDIKLFSIMSLVFTWHQFLLVFMFTFIIAGIFVTFYLGILRQRIKRVPLVPFITIATIVVLIFNHQINFYFLGGSYGN